MPGRSKKLLLLVACSMALTGAAQPAPAPGSGAQGAAAPASPADGLFAQGRFTEAGQAYEQMLARDPASPAALAGLARIRLYEGREAEAVELARQALALAAGNPVATAALAIAEQRRKQFGPELYQIEAPASPVALDFVVADPLPVVRLTIGGRERNFLLDTGGPDIILQRPLIDELGLTATDAGEGVFAGGRRAQVQRTVVPEVALGAIRIRNVPAGVLPGNGGGLRLPGVEIDGILGTGVLMHFLSTIDYCAGRLVLAPRSESAVFEARAAAGGANVVPMWLVGDHFVFARGRLNQAPEALFLIDTGLAGGGLSVPKASLEAAGITIDESQAVTGMGGGGPVRIVPFTADATLGTLTRRGVQGVHSPDGEATSIFPFQTGGLLSHGFFRQSRLTFDFEAMRLVTESCPTA